MKYLLFPSNLSGVVKAPSSKSVGHRMMIASALANNCMKLVDVGESDDIKATSRVLNSLGFINKIQDNSCYFSNNINTNNYILDCGESGSTLRFFLPIVSALGIKSKFIGSEKLLSRPSKELIECLNLHGANIDNFEVNGKLLSGEYHIDASISSQYITGLLFALPLLEDDSKLYLEGNVVSSGYIDITLDVLKQFNIDIEKTDYGFYIHHGKYSNVNHELYIEGDYSGSAFLLIAGLINGNIKITNLNLDSKQGDKEILNIINKFGGEFEINDKYIKVFKSNLHGTIIDCENIPDLVQPLSVLAVLSKGKTILKNVSRLKYKESDRLSCILEILKNSGINSFVVGNDLVIFGGSPLGGDYISYNDHRNVMMETILSMFSINNSTIENVEAVNKSYPDFFKDILSLGGKYVEI